MSRFAPLKFLKRLAGMLLIFLGTTLSHFLVPGNRRSLWDRANWLQRWSRRTLALLDIEVVVRGTEPVPGLITSNHLSYLDVLVLSSIRPQVFLAKNEVAGWPLFGAFARWAGTVFIDRRRRSEVSSKGVAFQEVVEAGLPVTVFLEGTTTDGSTVLPFRTALLEPAIRTGWAITPCAIHYEAFGAEASDTLCYHGEMTLVPHLLTLMGRVDYSRAEVCFGEPVMREEDRKKLAADLHQKVVRMKREIEGKTVGGRRRADHQHDGPKDASLMS
ncbi:MAG: lysophospholipid acyltransferase family protein [Opitutaceae bacterium]